MTNEQTRILKNVEEIFLPIVQQTFGTNLVAVILYGSVVEGGFTDRVSDVNTLILLREGDPGAIIRLGMKGKSSIAKNRINPLLLTENEYLTSADVFPLEYLDITESRKVIFGEDPTGKLDITAANLRHQVEGLLRGTIADLRRALLSSRGRNAVLRAHLRQWFGSQNALLRGMLRLGGEGEIPRDGKLMAKAVGEKFGIDTTPISELFLIRNGEKLDAAPVIERALGVFSELARSIDTMDV